MTCRILKENVHLGGSQFDYCHISRGIADKQNLDGTWVMNAGLVEYVERTVRSERSRAPDRPVYLVGESIGVCIALAVAARNRDVDLVLVLVNPSLSSINHGFCIALFFLLVTVTSY